MNTEKDLQLAQYYLSELIETLQGGNILDIITSLLLFPFRYFFALID